MRYDLDFGSANAGQTPTWTTFENQATGVAVSQPTIVEDGSGIYYFDFDWTTTTATAIRFKATCNLIELSDVIQSDQIASSAGSGSTTAAAMPWLWTAGNIINTVAVECGLSEVADPFASTDPNFIRLRTLLKTVGHELTQLRDWPVLIQECTITGDGASVLFSLPADFLRMKDQSGWNRTTQRPFGNPLSSQGWQFLKARTAVAQSYVYWRIVQGKAQFYTAPALNADYRFDYVSRYWAKTSGAATADLYHPTSSGDVVMFEPLMATKRLKVAFLEASGFDSGSAREEFARAYEMAAQEPASMLALDHGSAGEPRAIGTWNVADQGYGS